MPSNKEVNYFTVNWSRGPKWYESLYRNRLGQAWCGDVSPPCFLDMDSIGRIKEYNPEAKIIFSIRRPSEYALSLYNQFRTFTSDLPTFEEFLFTGYVYTRLGGPLYVRFMDDYIVRTIKSFEEAFGRNILIYRYEMLSLRALTVLKTIEQFLGIDPYFNDDNYDNLRINASDRVNLKWLNRILQNERTVALIQAMFPHNMIIRVRNAFDIISAPKKVASKSVLDVDMSLAKDALREQDEKVSGLFSGDSVIKL